MAGDAANLLCTREARETRGAERHERGAEEEREEREESNGLNLYLYLQETAQQLKWQGHVVQTGLAHGEVIPQAKLYEVVRRTQADLIVVTSHGRKGAHRPWVSSAATEVVPRAVVPVLLVNAEKFDEIGGEGEGYRAEQPSGEVQLGNCTPWSEFMGALCIIRCGNSGGAITTPNRDFGGLREA